MCPRGVSGTVHARIRSNRGFLMSAPRRTPEIRVTVSGFARRPWSAIPVEEVMRARVLTCAADAPLSELARTMVTHAVHAVVVVERDDDGVEYFSGIVTDRAVTQAGLEGRQATARELVDPESTTIPMGWNLELAAREMLRHGSAHVVVVDGRGAPIGMLSTLDLARITAWGHA
jgi:CBS domain-containing protein